MTEFSIYQINVDRDTANVCFIGMESLEKIKGTKEVNAAAYDRVYDGKMDCISLENIYQKFNVDHPADYKGRSLSVSDVVEIRGSDTLNPGFYFVDSIGFKSISFDKSLCKEPVEAGSRKISVLLVEPNKYPKMIEIDDTLEAMQTVVGGDIEEYMPFTPDDITFGSNKKVWWRGACGHEWQASVKARSNGEKCPICSGARVIAGINDLATLEPLLVKQWSKKNKIKPTVDDVLCKVLEAKKKKLKIEYI